VIRVVGLTRRFFDLVLLALVALVLGLVLIVNLAPLMGHRTIVIRGGSMEPGVPLGSLVDVTAVAPANLRAGDVVTLNEANGTLVTHRITRVVVLPDGLYFETKGDANPTPDPVLVPASAVTGRVDATIPKAGYLIFMLTQPGGVLSIFSLALFLLIAIWFLEDMERDAKPAEQVPWEDPDLERLVATAWRRPVG
jgi:signal peptidase I